MSKKVLVFIIIFNYYLLIYLFIYYIHLVSQAVQEYITQQEEVTPIDLVCQRKSRDIVAWEKTQRETHAANLRLIVSYTVIIAICMFSHFFILYKSDNVQ